MFHSNGWTICPFLINCHTTPNRNEIDEKEKKIEKGETIIPKSYQLPIKDPFPIIRCSRDLRIFPRREKIFLEITRDYIEGNRR